MAKKKTKKAAKPAKKPAAKPAPKAKKKPAKSSAAGAKKAAPSQGPVPVSTGKGDSSHAIGTDIVKMFNGGQFKEIENKYWAPSIVSIEGHGVSMGWHGRKAVDAKNAWWVSENSILNAVAEGPFAGATGFAIRFKMDIEEKKTGQRKSMDEVGVYTVRDGKIIQEEFMYGESKTLSTTPGVTPDASSLTAAAGAP